MKYFKLTNVILIVGFLSIFWVAIPAAFAGDPVPGSSENCMDDKWHNTGLNSQHLTCSAKEVFIEENLDGSKIISAEVVDGDDCAYPGDTATVNIVSDIHFNADRFDIGIYSAEDGGNALNGTCALDILNPDAGLPAANVDGDVCGDVDVGTDDGTFTNFSFQTLTLACKDDDRDGFLDFGVCFSWRTKGSNELCAGQDDIYPGSPSKCFCERVNINVKVPLLNLTVEKTANPSSVEEPGGLVTFTVMVTNPSPFAVVTLTTIADDEDNNTINDTFFEASTICFDDVLGPKENTSCTFTRMVTGNAGDKLTDKVTVTGIDSENREVTGSDTATVELVNVPSSIAIKKEASPTEVSEPGGEVDYTFNVKNTSAVDTVFISSVNDPKLGGEIGGYCTPKVSTVKPAMLAPGESLTCTVRDEFVGGNFGESIINTATAEGVDDDNQLVKATDSATVNITDQPGIISLTKTPKPSSLPEPGGSVEYEVVLTNESVADTVTISSIIDDLFGDIGSSCLPELPADLLPGEIITCTFTESVMGNAFGSHTNTITATGVDDDGVSISQTATATVNFTNVGPAASLTKTVTNICATYQVRVTNDSAAEELTLTDLKDDVYPNITISDGKLITSTDCYVPQTLAPKGQEGDAYTCTFTACSSTSPGTDIVTGTVLDDEGGKVTPYDCAEVTFGDPDQCEQAPSE